MQQLQNVTEESASGPFADACARQVLNVTPPVIRVIRQMMRRDRLADLSEPQFRALALLSRCPKATLSSVADVIGSSLPGASRMIDGLVAKKMVERCQCSSDRRQISLGLTAAGETAFRGARAATRLLLAERLQFLSVNQREVVIQAMEILGGVFGSDARILQDSKAAKTDCPKPVEQSGSDANSTEDSAQDSMQDSINRESVKNRESA
jgi:DNA-binding MarR family transcriptional regulator